jgi:hypothetical protein
VKRWIHRSIVVTLSTLSIAAAGISSAHAACPAGDPVCLEETVVAGQSLVDDTIRPVDVPGDEAVAPVTDIVDRVLDDVQDRLDDLLGGGVVDPPDPIGSGGGGGSHSPGGGSHPPGKEPGGTPRHPPGHGDPVRGRIPGGPGLDRVTGPSGHAPSNAGPSGAVLRDPDPASRDRFGAALEGVARSLAIVLALFGLAVGFVAIQDRLDRSDPRLALAPVESDIAEFA